MCFIYDEYAEWFTQNTRKARKEHPCEGCCHKVKPGEIHLHCRGKYEGDFFQYRVCGACELDIYRVHLFEIAEGCEGQETYPWPNDISYGLDAHELERSTREDGQEWMRRGQRGFGRTNNA